MISQSDPWTLAIVYHIGTSRHVTPDTPVATYHICLDPLGDPFDYDTHLPLCADPFRDSRSVGCHLNFIPRLALLRSPSGIPLGCIYMCLRLLHYSRSPSHLFTRYVPITRRFIPDEAPLVLSPIYPSLRQVVVSTRCFEPPIILIQLSSRPYYVPMPTEPSNTYSIAAYQGGYCHSDRLFNIGHGVARTLHE